MIKSAWGGTGDFLLILRLVHPKDGSVTLLGLSLFGFFLKKGVGQHAYISFRIPNLCEANLVYEDLA